MNHWGLLVVGMVVLVILVGLVLMWTGDPRRWRARYFTPVPVVPQPINAGLVTLQTGTTIRGAIERYQDGLRLRSASMGQLNQQTRRIDWQPLNGDVIIPFANIDFWQEGFDPNILSPQ